VSHFETSPRTSQGWYTPNRTSRSNETWSLRRSDKKLPAARIHLEGLERR
jgi:hypothetical protein